MAEPTRFGFLDEDPAPIMVTGSSLSLRSNSLSLVGGGLFLNGTSIESRSGHMSLASVASPGEAVIEGADIQLDDFDRLGPISLVGSDLRASEGFVPGVGAGSIRIVGGQFVMDGARIRSFAFDEDAGDIHIETSEGIELVNGSEVVSNAQSAGQGANILIDTQGDLRVGPNTRILTHSEDAGAAGAIVANVENLIITDDNISSWAWGAGDAGDIRITARDTVSISGPASDFAVGIASIAASDAGNAGNAGSLVITADTLTMNGGTINTETLLSAGAAGDITIEVGTLEMTKEAIISTASRRGQGAAGTLSVDASEGVSLRGRSILQSTTSSDGAGGSILVSTPDLVLRDRSAIQSFTLGSADAGDIVLDVGNLTLVNSQINSDAQPGSRGNGGNITLTASGTIQLLNPDNDFLFKPRISSTTLGSGDSGQITISAREVILDNGAIDTNTLRSGSGNAGRIVVDVGRLTVKNGGSIDSGSGLGSSGLGGEIIVNATEAVTISGAALAFGLELQSGITTITTGSGDAGSITITAPILEIDLGDVAATTAGSGKGGTITLNVDRLSLTGGGQYSGEVGRLGRGGKYPH